MRVVLVSYTFPPVGGAGVGRVLKLSKFLPEHGIEPVVLTAANPSVPVQDPGLARDLPPDLEIHRVRTLEPSYRMKRAAWRERAAREASGGRAALRQRAIGLAAGLARRALVPDPQILWQPAARRALTRLLQSPSPPEVVLISGPPFSQFTLAPRARKAGAQVILDYRDEWSTYREIYEMSGRLRERPAASLEHSLARTASAITTATEGFRENLLGQISGLDPARVITIPNGFDPDDIPQPLPEPPRERFVLTYAGTMFRLTRPSGLLAALRRLHEREPSLAELLEVQVIGRVVDTEAAAFEGSDRLGVRRLGYLSKDETMRALAASHMTLCLLDDAPGAERVYPAKIFELMAIGRPCLTIAPPGMLAELASRHRLGPVAHPRDAASIANILAGALHAFRDGRYRARSEAVEIERYHRREQAAAFAEVIRRVARRAPATPRYPRIVASR
jgi:glycosyltransferase involved in cell wall biosynthesis